MESKGILYIAVQSEAYLEAAVISALSIRLLDRLVPITIVSDLPLIDYLDLIKYNISARRLKAQEIVPHPFFSRYLKTQLSSYTPYDQTLFLDADILAIQDISHIWHYLDQGDLAIARDRLSEVQHCDHIAQVELDFTLSQLPANFPHYNSGVFLWRKTAASELLFKHWHQEWLHFQCQDQLALARAIAKTALTLTPLPQEQYNISPRDAEPLLKQGKPVYLLHCWGEKVSTGRFKKLCLRFCPAAVQKAEDLWQVLTLISPLPDSNAQSYDSPPRLPFKEDVAAGQLH
ncbi:MAG: putative nucleotide-diphospho-sugar transferase [Prochlorotrichaceae cyanobacterium]|jgi:lipopolysaccharide biosynthesis glycosyltransferase